MFSNRLNLPASSTIVNFPTAITICQIRLWRHSTLRLLQSFALISTLIFISAPSSCKIRRAQPPKQQPLQTAHARSNRLPRFPTPTPVPLPPPTVRVGDYRTAARIIRAALTSDRAYARLAYLTDRIGNRLSGSKNLERAIEWAACEMSDGLDTAYAPKVMVPHWVRGEESLEMISPEPRKLSLLGLGNSVRTPPEGIAAEAVVVRSFRRTRSTWRARARKDRGRHNEPFVKLW